MKSLPKSAENASSTFGPSVGVTFKLNLPPKGQGVREICIPLHGVRQWEIPSPLVQPRGWPKVLRSIELTAVPFYHLLFFCGDASRFANILPVEFMRAEKREKPCG